MTAYNLTTAFTTSFGLLVEIDYNSFFRFVSKSSFRNFCVFSQKTLFLKQNLFGLGGLLHSAAALSRAESDRFNRNDRCDAAGHATNSDGAPHPAALAGRGLSRTPLTTTGTDTDTRQRTDRGWHRP